MLQFQIRHLGILTSQYFLREFLLVCYNENCTLQVSNLIFNVVADAQRFEPSLLPTSQLTRGAQPYRSVYTRDPTTRTYSPRSSVPSVGSKNPSVACLSVPPPLQKSSSYTSVSRNEPRPYLATSVSTGALPSQPVSSKLKVKVLKTGKLYDSLSNKIPTYQTHSKNRGKALVINNIKFLDEKQYRQGAEVDETNITKLFKEMGFKVINHRDKTKSVSRYLTFKIIINDALPYFSKWKE